MSEVITDKKAIEEIMDRGTIVEVLPTKKEFIEKLSSGERMRFYIGFDATAPTLHLSHAKNIMLLEKFRKLGHEAIVLFGDFTARIGDPTGESSTRKQLTREEVMANVEKWKSLIRPLMNFDDEKNPPIIKYNHDWLSKLSMEDLIGLSANFTVQQMLERDMFQKRMTEGKPIFLHEFLYPLMQGYDSAMMDVDVEICGTDQTFNALAGRTLQKRINNKEKFVVAVTLMENPKTGELMSKSKGTGVFLDTGASDMYGQIMSQPDEMMEILFLNCTLLSKDEIKEILSLPPRDAKMKLAHELVKLFHGEDGASEAQNDFIERFQNKNKDNAVEFNLGAEEISLVDALIKVGFVSSKTEAKKLMEQGGIRVNGETMREDSNLSISSSGVVLERGKLKVIKLIP